MTTVNTTRREYGVQSNVEPSWHTRAGRREYTAGTPEPTPELTWPHSIAVFDQMERSDGQVSSLIRACTLPIYQARWHVNGAGCRPEVATFIRQQLGLPEEGESFDRTSRRGVAWSEHLPEALKNALVFGHMPFEQVYEVVPVPEEMSHIFAGERMINLRKLAARHPRTLSDVVVASDGGLLGIRQHTPLGYPHQLNDDVFIPVENLVMYTLEREGAEWTGRSILRSAYKHWFIKEHLIRLDAQIAERNGMGIPVYQYDETMETKEDAERLVEEFRAGERAGMSIPLSEAAGIERFKLIGVSGSTVDLLPKINYHDQAISKAGLTMFLDLGHDSGARSLGDTFVDFFTGSLQAVADGIATTATEHIIRDLVTLNFGPEEPYPSLEAGDLTQSQNVSTTTLTSLADSGLITPDFETENTLRRRYSMPAKAEGEYTPPTEIVPTGERPAVDPSTPGLPVAAAAPDLDRLEGLIERLEGLRGGHGH